MRYLQRYEYYEYIKGKQVISFVVSDNYEELYDGDYIETDIFVLESVKQELNLDEGSFAIDELPFSANHLSCKNASDEEALYFVLDSANVQVNRYCAVFFGDINLSNLVFSGKISSNIRGNDLLWTGSEYESAINPKRDYSFTAYSFDVSILEQCKFTEKIYDSNNQKVNNIYEQFDSENWQSAKDIFQWRDSFITKLSQDGSPADTFLYKTTPLATLFDAIQMYLDKSELIIEQLINTSVSFNLVPVTFGLKSSPAQYYFQAPSRAMPFDNVLLSTKASNTAVELTLSPDIMFGSSSPAYIQRKLIEPDFVKLANGENEAALSFKSLNNTADLLYSLAQAFACYIIFSYNTNIDFNIEFKSRSSLIESEYTQIIGAEDASFDTSSIAAEGQAKFKGKSTIVSLDGLDWASNTPGRTDYEKSERLIAFEEQEKNEKDKYNIEYKQVLLTTSDTRRVFRKSVAEGLTTVINTTPKPPVMFGDYAWDTGLASFAQYQQNQEMLFSGIYISTLPTDGRDIDLLGLDHYLWRPALHIYCKIDGKNEQFGTLTDYLNAVAAKDSEFYKTEYDITVPFWNGFKKLGVEPSWKNVKLGSVIPLSEKVKSYDDSTKKFVEITITKAYVVVGIERSLSKPETKLKLHNLSRFAYNEFDGTPVVSQNSAIIPAEYTDEKYESYEIDAGGQISEGDAVMLQDNGKILRSIPNSEYYGKTIGIAKQSGVAGDFIVVQISGVVSCIYYNFDTSKEQVFVQVFDNISPPFNVSQSPNDTPTAEYDTYIILGKVFSPSSFFLDIKEYCYENINLGANN